ncbi:MAG: hypothetical protein OXH19_08695 [Chloroflexi bacterium]|nr:hypothetical protein [Chloroflexota bacterium]MCY3588851.1 hypothetical protein [Chloroflexota bacterium]MCY3685718.1 hypothetical protein [Chloroflexota bacterium]MDE2709202.1 hypothetical protein [Chloroflexota bacterium]
MTKMSTMPKLVAGAVVALIGLVALSASAFAQPATPHQFYGGGLEAGDVVAIGDASGTADADGNWYIRVAAEGVDENSFTLNGKSASATLTSVSDSLTQVDIEAMSMPEGDGMEEPGDGMEEPGDGMEEPGDGMEEPDEQLDEDKTDVGMPSTGSGGLADSSGISAGLIGLLIALGAAAIAGLGLRRVRNRA